MKKFLALAIIIIMILGVIPITPVFAAEIKTVTDIADFQSAHPYVNEIDITWVYTYPTAADALDVTFSSDTRTEEKYDLIYIYDANDTETAKHSGTTLAGQTVRVQGNVVKVRLVSDKITAYYGFRVTDVVPWNTNGPIIDLRKTGATQNSITFGFSPCAGATGIVLQSSDDNGLTWAKADTDAAITPTAHTVTAINLARNTQAKFRIAVTGGVRNGITNTVAAETVFSPFDGEGTERNPYKISTAMELNEVRNHLNKHFIQIAIIDKRRAARSIRRQNNF